MPEDNSAKNAAVATKPRGRLVPIIIVAVMMLGEGVVVFMLAKALNPAPTPAMAGDGTDLSDPNNGTAETDLVEVDVAECRPSNKMSGKFVTYHIRVSVLVEDKDRETLRDTVRAKQARIDDAVNTTIRAANPVELNEPGLESIRRRLRYEFGRVFGDDEIVRQVLIPQLLQSGPGL